MKIRNLSLVAIAAISLTVVSCSKEESTAITSDESQVTINDDTNGGIQDFINQVNGVTTRVPDPSNPGMEQHHLREFIDVEKGCQEGIGNCLPDVVITPDGPGSIVKPTHPGGWTKTQQGKQLQQMVDNKQITMKREVNPSTNTEYYIYNGVENKKVEIVVPVAYK